MTIEQMAMSVLMCFLERTQEVGARGSILLNATLSSLSITVSLCDMRPSFQIYLVRMPFLCPGNRAGQLIGL